MKNMNFWKVTILMLGSAVPTISLAADDYLCKIEKVVSASGSTLDEFYIGKKFTVDRVTGLMAGALKNSYLTAPEVIDGGSKENSYKVVTVMRKDQGVGVGSNVYALIINEYQEGKRKKFIFLQNDDVYMGWCEHL